MKIKPTAIVKGVRLTCIFVWVAIIVACISTYLVYPSLFTAEKIAAFLRQFTAAIWLAYLVMSMLRGLTLLPSTPLVLAGTVLFPAQPVTVLAVSMVGIVFSSSMIYFFSELLGFSEYFEGHKPEQTHRIRKRLEHPLGSLFVAAWAFFPLVPTDLVCYLAGTTKMSYPKFIAAVFLGEIILCSVYIFFGGTLMNLVR
jgi:uncharacterized membrane protein YdjX (TVP38/TMEM64 family)